MARSTCLMGVLCLSTVLVVGVRSQLFSSITALHRLMKQGQGHRLAARDLEARSPQDGSTVVKGLTELGNMYKEQPFCVEHPVTALKIIQTFVDLSNRTDNAFQVAIRKKGLLWPTDDDVTGTYHALARIQKTYELIPDDVIKGDLAGIRSPFGLDEDDILAVAEQMINIGDNKTAVTWLNRTWSDESTLLRSRRLVERISAQPIAALCLDGSRDSDIVNKALYRDRMRRYPEYERLCQKSLRPQQRRSSDPRLHCSYRSGRTPYLRYRCEYHSLDPLIVTFYDVITDKESLFVRGVASHVMANGGIAIKGERHDVSSYDNRVGHVGWLYDNSHPIIARISVRIADITGLSTKILRSATHAEPFQVCNYGLAGHFRPHQDAFADGVTNLPEIAYSSGNRDATFMLYLTDVLAGGATVFPELGVYVRPVKNSAVFWLNTRRSGRRDQRTVHAGCPVLVGNKWIANKWMWSVGQTFRRRCGLTEHATDIEMNEWH